MELFQLISNASALFMCWLFVQAGVHKLNPKNDLYFSSLIAEYGLANVSVAGLVSKLVGLIELSIGIAIVYPPTRPEAAMLAAIVLFGYLVHMAYQLLQGRRDLDCGCSGPAGDLKMSGHLLVRNALMVVIAAFCFAPYENAAIGLWVLGFGLASVGIFINMSSEQLIGNAQKLKALRT